MNHSPPLIVALAAVALFAFLFAAVTVEPAEPPARYVFFTPAGWAEADSLIDWAIPMASPNSDTVCVKPAFGNLPDSTVTDLLALGIDSTDIVSLHEARDRVSNWHGGE
ncbi:MAG: hypothetical protein MAG453_00799 [Calditrichaeota bacterium]|nr:hypothetical protein [Calditrichota bacterium]